MSVLARPLQEQTATREQQQPMTGSKKQGSVVTLQTVSVEFPKKSLVFGIMAAFCLCFLILVRYGIMAELNLEIGQMNRDYAMLKETGRMLQVEIESNLQLDVIRTMAETELGMHAPSMNQVISVQVPKSAYSVVSDAAYLSRMDAGDRSVWSRLAERMGAVVP